MENKRLYIKIAHWYYTLGMTQDEIAKRLSFTRQKVNRIINSLKDMGVVSITVNGYEKSDARYECELEEHFGLQQVIIAESYEDMSNYIPTLANTAAQYLEEIIQPESIIGVSWGKTLAEVINNLPYLQKPNCQVVQMIGAQNTDGISLKADEIARSLANKLDSPCQILYAPAVLKNPQTKALLMEEPTIAKAYELIKKCTMAVVGIGEVTAESTMCRRGYISKEEIKELRSQGFIGDICMNLLKKDGKADSTFTKERIITASMEILDNIPNVIAIAGGEDKVNAIIAALNSGVINTLIIDANTAKKIVDVLEK